MSASQPAATALHDPRIPVQAKLAAAWTSVMFLYAYVDILGFYKPGHVDGILDGKIWEFDATQTMLTTALVLMSIPILMILMSMSLPARANRITNLVVASIQIPYAAFNLAGEEWMVFFGLGVALEVLIFVLILRWAWTWPRTAPTPNPATSPHHATFRSQQQA